MAVFEQLRISLDREEAGPLLSEHEEKFRSRREFLEDAFSEDRIFPHLQTGKPIEFVPLPIDGDYLAGIFKRAHPIPAHDHSLQPYKAENYEGAVFLLSVSKDQIAWMQHNKRLGANKALLDSFFSHLKSKSAITDWRVYVEYMTDEEEYWSVIQKRRAEIAKITFTFLPPNALSATGRIAELIKIVSQEADPDVQQHAYSATPGKMKPDTPHMAASARIAMDGGGEADVRTADNRVIYRSHTATKVTSDIPEDNLPNENNPTFIRRVRDWLYSR